jgi:hypothetical protein
MKRSAQMFRLALILTTGLLLTGALTGCLVAGVSSSGGWFIWPGSLGLIVIIVIAALLMRRR